MAPSYDSPVVLATGGSLQTALYFEDATKLLIGEFHHGDGIRQSIVNSTHSSRTVVN